MVASFSSWRVVVATIFALKVDLLLTCCSKLVSRRTKDSQKRTVLQFKFKVFQDSVPIAGASREQQTLASETVRVLCRKSLPGFVDPKFVN
jgi:hypothetical protein